MDLEKVREALDEERFGELEAYVNDLIGQRDSARKESINHRQGLKSKATELETENEQLKRAQTELLERLGVESVEQIAELDPKGQAEAARQYEAKLKRIEREMSERDQAYQALEAKHKGTLQEAAMRKAMADHEWVDGELVASFVQNRLAWDDDDIRYRADDGLLMDLTEGLQTLAKEKPHLLKTTGAGGSGYRASRRDGEQPKQISRTDFDNLAPAARMSFIKGGGSVTE